MRFYVNTKCRRKDGTFDSFCTIGVRFKHDNIGAESNPCSYMVLWNDRWRRVRSITLPDRRYPTYYLGRKYDECLTVSVEM